MTNAQLRKRIEVLEARIAALEGRMVPGHYPPMPSPCPQWTPYPTVWGHATLADGTNVPVQFTIQEKPCD